MKALVVYESVFGNTKHIAEAIAEGLRESAEVELHEVGGAPTSLEGIDILVVGGPTHAWGMSRAATREDARKQAQKRDKEPVSRGIGVREWLAGLPKARGTRSATFDTAGKCTWFPVGSAAKQAAQKLQEKGYRRIATPEQFRVGDVAGPLLSGEIERAKAWGAALVVAASLNPAVEPPLSSKKKPSRASYVAAILVNVLFLILVHRHETWRPWLGGVVTERWAEILWMMNISLGMQIATNAILFLASPTWLRRLGDLVNAVIAVISISVMISVYPFAFGGFDGVARILMRLVQVACVIAAVVNMGLLLSSIRTVKQEPVTP